MPAFSALGNNTNWHGKKFRNDFLIMIMIRLKQGVSKFDLQQSMTKNNKKKMFAHNFRFRIDEKRST